MRSQQHTPSPRGGFTLVEMLVSAGLIMVVMLMFAQVYQVAGESVSRQKGIAENDQRSRLLTTIIQNDIKARTFRNVLPIMPAPAPAPTADPVGYFYISENDPLDDSDDVFQCTVALENNDAPITGHARRFDAPSADVINQPDGDDGQIFFAGGVRTLTDPVLTSSNATGASKTAEVVYFLRNGNLYRRVLLIRDPLDAAPAQPPDFPAGDYPAAPYPPAVATNPQSFWNEYDYSAFAQPAGTQFQSTAGLLVTGATNFELGRPHFRFGHDILSGQPREYVNQPGPNLAFIGRFTHEETSHWNFGYPGRTPDLDNDGTFDNPPLSPVTNLALVNGTVSYDDGVDGTWGNADDPQFKGTRRGEDILMSNVHSFDVKVFDQAYDETAANADLNHDGRLNIVGEGGAFADVGHGAVGDYAQTRKRHLVANNPPITADITYGPRTPAQNNIFDTWHYAVDITNADGDNVPYTGAQDQPPFWPNTTGAIANPGDPNVLPRPMRAIQITIRFFDVASNQMRQLTLVESLVDTD